MNNPYIIIFDSAIEKEKLELLFEAIRSSFVSKKATNNIFIIAVPLGERANSIYNTIDTKLITKVPFVVTTFIDYFGNMPLEIFSWFKQTFPQIDLLEPITIQKNISPK